jgi:hypothetical protein
LLKIYIYGYLNRSQICGRQCASVISVAAAMRGHASAWSSFRCSVFLPRV